MASNFEASSQSAPANPAIAEIQMPPLFSAAEAVAVKQQVEATCQQSPRPDQIVLDFRETTFMDSSGIGSLVRCHTLVENQGLQLLLTHVSPTVMMALSLTELDQVLNIVQEGDEPAAIGATETGSSPRSAVVMTHPSVHSKTKRLMDIVGGCCGLALTAFVIFPLVAIAIKIEDGGPIFFSQVRCSWLGRRFRMWKFRSMVINAEAIKHTVENKAQGALFKNPEDPRITKVGRFLRRTSLDEFPQFWNVVRGEMSLVGTRPPTPDELERYEILQWSRLDIKPGITGEWQVNGRSNVTDFEDVVKLDMRYQENWSLWYDCSLIFKTALLLFNKNSGAY
ncbi:MAG: sugar transferase [Prochlorothrix sp.]|nr:sugar transferase [Prochlorothrix sp.]